LGLFQAAPIDTSTTAKFDVLNIQLEEKDGKLIAHAEHFLDRLARPIDVCARDGKLYIVLAPERGWCGAEYRRAPERIPNYRCFKEDGPLSYCMHAEWAKAGIPFAHERLPQTVSH
jgi:hypothetical protein